LRRSAEQQVMDDEPGALRQQLHRGIGVGHAGRPVVGEQQRPHAFGIGAAGEQAAQLGGAGVDQHHVAMRRGLHHRVQE
jgi:hypothetical protein